MKQSLFDHLTLYLAALGGIITYWLGGLDHMLIALLAVTTIDYLTGLLKAVHTQRLSSDVGFRGIVRKVLMLTVVALSFIVEELVGGQLPLREMVIIFFVANEGLSILENAAQSGLPIPEKFKVLLGQIYEKGDVTGD